MKTVGFIDYYLDEFHANKYPAWLKAASQGELEVKYAYAVMDSPLPGGMTTKAWCEKNGIIQVASIEELIEKSDCINVLSPDNPEQHETLCALPLRSGKPTYVDKTFAESAESAKRLFSWAEESDTPCFSASALRFAPELESLRGERVEGVVSVGPGPLFNYSIHQLEPIVALMGPGAIGVCSVGTLSHPALVIQFEGGRRARFSHHGWDCPFAMTVDLPGEKTRRLEITSDYFAAFVKAMAEFFLHSVIPVPHQDTVAVIALRQAVVGAASRPGEWVQVLL